MLKLLVAYANRLTRRRPDYIIGETSNPYMLRWWVIPRNRILNIYLNVIFRSDDDRALHDHPWHNMSFLLEGGYLEIVPMRQEQASMDDSLGYTWGFRRTAGEFVFRKATDRHRLVVAKPCMSLFFTGPVFRKWGFHCSKGFVPHDVYLKPTSEYGQSLVGRGCE